jgi:hypothetical protein
VSENNKIQDIPSFRKVRSDAKNLKAFKEALPVLHPALKLMGADTDQIDQALKKIDVLEESVEDLITVPDRFNDHFAPLGWIMYEEMDLQIAKIALEKADSGDVIGAETYLTEYYNPEIVQQKLHRMNHIEEFRRRMPLAQKALTDYCRKRYHACVPVMLALIDGMVNELHLKARGKRLGLSAEAVNLEAWDSVSAHSKGLGNLVRVLMKGRNMTTTQQISIPYRNGIMHGTDLGYDNKIVAAKTWALLFSLRDWAIKAERGAIEKPLSAEKTTTPLDLIHIIKKNQEDKRRLHEWTRRNIKPGQDIPASAKPEDYADGSPERTLAEFLDLWRVKNYGFMSQRCLSGLKGKANPGDLNLSYSKRLLKAFEFEEIHDQAASVTVITTQLTYEDLGQEIKKSFAFRLINLDTNWEPQIRGDPGSRWFILNWNCL